MTIDYTVCGQVRIKMMSYIEGIITSFNKADLKGKGTKLGTATNNLFVVNEDCKKLKQDKVVEFHHLVANTLYATKKSRPDTCTAIAFMTIMVSVPNKGDCVKLVHLI